MPMEAGCSHFFNRLCLGHLVKRRYVDPRILGPILDQKDTTAGLEGLHYLLHHFSRM